MLKKQISVLFVIIFFCLFNGSFAFSLDTTIQNSDINEGKNSHEDVFSTAGMIPSVHSPVFSFNSFYEHTWYDHHDPIIIEGNDNFTEKNGVRAGSGISIDPYVIDGWDIYCFRHTGILLRNISVYFVIRYCHLYGGSSYTDGIVFCNVTHGIVDSNFIEQNRYGVFFYPQDPGRQNSSHNIISNNTITLNSEDGISFEHTGSGWHSHNFIIHNNISHNKRGVYLIMSDNNTIAYNNISSNNGYGIELDRCMGGGEWNRVHHNNFIENTGDQGQVLEWGDPCNYWNDSYPSGGNYWSDYTGIDIYHGPHQDLPGSDGIGDIPHPIPEDQNQDHYPLMMPWNIVNIRPDKPCQPAGETQGKIRDTYLYTTRTTDPDGDHIYYLWDWGDGSTSGWLGPFTSGDLQETNHTWTVKGTYEIKVKAKDTYGYQSEWSDSLPISMPYSYSLKNRLLELLIQYIPQVFSVLTPRAET